MAVTKTASELVAEAKGRIENLTVEQLAAEIAAGDAVLVDLREPEELTANGKIPGSLNVPRGMLEFRADPTSSYHQEPLDPSKRVIVHCAAGGRSALAAATLQDMGYERVAQLEGGFNAWKQAGHPTE
ncbi:MAG: rhodanese-like domain-containing protein [Ilumatobacteraceae bacterium]